MKWAAITTLLTVLVAPLSMAAGPGEIVAGGYLSPDRYPGMELAWRDEFDGSGLDEHRWQRTTGAGDGAELQWYVAENARVAGGYLRLVAESPPREDQQFTSARLVSRSPEPFGRQRIDVRLSLPEGQGLLSYVRLQDEGGSGVDILEMVGGNESEGTVYGTLRWNSDGRSRYEGGSLTLPGDTFTGQFHVFSVVWEANQIRWLADGREYFRQQLPADSHELSDAPLRLVLGLAVGGDRAGSPDDNTAFPRQLVVDYIRVFRDSH
jgi:beta-glucanase (GH16 family)